MSPFLEFERTLAQSQNQPVQTFDGVCALAQSVVGLKLFTMTILDHNAKQARRIYSNMPDAYPLLGTKPMCDDPWSEQVLGRHEIFVANNIEAISAVFNDFELIRSLGCESVINIPILVAGQVLGTLNCLHVADHYQAEAVARSEELKLPGAVAFLLNNSIQSTTEQGVH